MTRFVRRHTLVSAALVAAAATATAQSKPDFSGRWVYVSPEAAAGQEQTITQTETTLTTGHASEGGGHHATYRLDGTESRNVMASHGQEIVSVSKATWDGERLVISTSTTYPDGRRLESKHVWSLDAQQRLVIDSTETIAARPARTSRAVLTRKQQ